MNTIHEVVERIFEVQSELNGHIVSLTKTLKNLGGELTQDRAELAKVKTENIDLNDRIKVQLEHIEELKEELENAKSENQNLNIENLELKDEIEHIKDVKKALESRLEESKKELEESKKLFSDTEITHHPRKD